MTEEHAPSKLPDDSTFPLVSVLIPCHNAEKWLRQCLGSALNQTYPNIEVLVVDDGSKDGSARILQEYAGRIRYEIGPNRGANAARNRLMAMSSGPWIQFLDADDYLCPEKIARQMKHIATRPDLDVVYAPCTIRFEPSGKEFPHLIEDKSDGILTYIRWQYTTHGPLFRRSAIDAAGGWSESQPCCQENELLLRLIRRDVRFGLFDQADCVYRFHGIATISKRFPQRVIRQRMALTDELEAHLIKTNRMTPQYGRAIARSRFESARSIYGLDKSYAKALAARARAEGPVPPTHAAPWAYRMILNVLGFDWAERLAALRRSLFTRGNPQPVL